MNVNDININSMDVLFGDLYLLSTQEEINDVDISLSEQSKEKLVKTLISQRLVRENQDLIIIEMVINKNSETLLQKGQDALIKNNNMLVCTTQSTNHARFKGILNTKVLLKRSEDYAVAQITLGNIEFDFSDALREADDDEIVYRNVKLTMYPGSYSISILGD